MQLLTWPNDSALRLQQESCDARDAGVIRLYAWTKGHAAIVSQHAEPAGMQVNTGMMKLYQAEVLSKVPIMQHFLFGHLIGYPQV